MAVKTSGKVEIRADERYQVLPDMPPEQYEALKADIEERGVMVPIDITEDGYILDGHHRHRACVELGITDYPVIVRPDLDEQERRVFARNNNMLRRHLNRKQVRELIVAQLKDTPDWANNRIAQSMGVDKKTVQTQRRRLESTGEIPKLTKFIGADGKKRKKRPTAVMAPNAEELQQILDKLQGGVDDIEGFCSAHGMATFVDATYDPMHGLTDEEEREWFIYSIECPWPDWEWLRQRGFQTPSDFYGPEGQGWMASVGFAKKNPERNYKRWQKCLAKYKGKGFQELRQQSQEALRTRYEP